jgi:hypothetical protein
MPRRPFADQMMCERHPWLKSRAVLKLRLAA